MVRRKAAGTLRVTAIGRAAHSGSAPDQGRNALLGLAHTATALAGHHDPSGPDRLSVVPTVIRSGDAFNVVPAAGELLFDMRADGLEAFEAVLAAVPPEFDGVGLEARMERKWPGMNAIESTRGLLERAGARLGRPIVGGSRGGASDASHFAAGIPITIDGLGPARRRRAHPAGVRARPVAARAGRGGARGGRARRWIVDRRPGRDGSCGYESLKNRAEGARAGSIFAAMSVTSPTAKGVARQEGIALLAGMVALMWVVELINSVDNYRLDRDGLYPHNVDRIWGIFTAPFLHASWSHLIGNTIPFVFMGADHRARRAPGGWPR